MNDRIKVICRIRPLNASEISRNEENILKVTSSETLEMEYQNGTMNGRTFQLDAVLDSNTTQEDVFTYIQPLLEDGQTGTGKTFTMLGYDLWGMAKDAQTSGTTSPALLAKDENFMGIVPRSMKWLLHVLNKNYTSNFNISVSYLELYNDIKVIDLLDKTIPSGTTAATNTRVLDIRENKNGDIIIPGLTRIAVNNTSEVLEVLWDGAKSRSVASTDMNDHSSRSHTVFIVYVEITIKQETRRSKICLVDLAGSEKWKSHQLSQFSEARIKELTSINRSLSALGNCISALLKAGRAHIPYRDSKLTRLLQDSLGGNTRTLFAVTLSPSESCFEETLSTLQFADRAMRVQIVASSNKTFQTNGNMMEHMQLKYESEIKRLKLLLNLIVKKSGIKMDLNTLALEIGSSQRGLVDDLNADAHKDGNVDYAGVGGDFDACLSKELNDMKEENFNLMQELSKTQEEFRVVKEEKQRILNALFDLVGGGGTKDGESEGSSHYDELVVSRLESAIQDLKKDEGDKEMLYKMQYKVLQLQREDTERRKEAMEEAGAQQEDRWQWLQQYHTWLQSQSSPRNENETVQSDDIYKRVCLMEASVLLQADELQRTKKSFLKANGGLHQRLQDSERTIEELMIQKALIEHKQRATMEELEELKNRSLAPMFIEGDDIRNKNGNSATGHHVVSSFKLEELEDMTRWDHLRSSPLDSAVTVENIDDDIKPQSKSKPPEPSLPPPPPPPPEDFPIVKVQKNSVLQINSQHKQSEERMINDRKANGANMFIEKLKKDYLSSDNIPLSSPSGLKLFTTQTKASLDKLPTHTTGQSKTSTQPNNEITNTTINNTNDEGIKRNKTNNIKSKNTPPVKNKIQEVANINNKKKALPVKSNDAGVVEPDEDLVQNLAALALAKANSIFSKREKGVVDVKKVDTKVIPLTPAPNVVVSSFRKEKSPTEPDPYSSLFSSSATSSGANKSFGGDLDMSFLKSYSTSFEEESSQSDHEEDLCNDSNYSYEDDHDGSDDDKLQYGNKIGDSDSYTNEKRILFDDDNDDGNYNTSTSKDIPIKQHIDKVLFKDVQKDDGVFLTPDENKRKHVESLDFSSFASEYLNNSKSNINSDSVTEVNTTLNTNYKLKSPATPKKSKKKLIWKEAIDASSGMTYYYNRLTNITTWEKPSDAELAMLDDGSGVSLVDEVPTSNIPAVISTPIKSSAPSQYSATTAIKKISSKNVHFNNPISTYHEIHSDDAPSPKLLLSSMKVSKELSSHSILKYSQISSPEVLEQVTPSSKTNTSSKSKSKKKKIWKEAIDASTGMAYYYNRLTNITTWEKPSDAELAMLDDGSGNDNIFKESLTIENVISKSLEEESVQSMPSTAIDEPNISSPATVDRIIQSPEKKRVWNELFDVTYGQYYYYNTVTFETTWQKPNGDQLEMTIDDTSSVDICSPDSLKNTSESDLVVNQDLSETKKISKFALRAVHSASNISTL